MATAPAPGQASGVAMVVLFFAGGRAPMLLANSTPAGQLFLLVAVGYVLRVVLLLAAFVNLGEAAWLDRQAVAATVVAGALGWTGCLGPCAPELTPADLRDRAGAAATPADPADDRTTENRWEHHGPEADPWSAMSMIISGVLLWGAIGWGLRVAALQGLHGCWCRHRGVLGVLVVYLRYGRAQSGPPATVGPVVLPGPSEVTTTLRTPPAAPTRRRRPHRPPTAEEDTP